MEPARNALTCTDANGSRPARRQSRPIRRGSAKSGQVVGWVMSLMARFGCRDRDLVVEAIAAWAPWARRMRPGGQVAQGGHDLGAVAGAQLVAVLIEDDVTDRRGAGSRFPSALGPRRQPARAGPVPWAVSRPGYATSTCFLPLMVLVRRTWRT